MIVSPSSSPPPPSHWFALSGYVTSIGGGSVANYTVGLFGRTTYTGSEWERLGGSCYSGECLQQGARLVITGENGRFSLGVCSCSKPDSVAAAVILPDTLMMSPPIPIADLNVTEFFKSRKDDGLVCDNTTLHVSYYGYNQAGELTVAVP